MQRKSHFEASRFFTARSTIPARFQVEDIDDLPDPAGQAQSVSARPASLSEQTASQVLFCRICDAVSQSPRRE